MKVKWNNQTIDIENRSNNSKYFYTWWNSYYVEITKENDPETYYIICAAPDGCYIYDGYFHGTFQEALQDCFDNIGYPLMDNEDDEDGDDPTGMEDAYKDHMNIY